jgi:RHS repeat-associated protein
VSMPSRRLRASLFRASRHTRALGRRLAVAGSTLVLLTNVVGITGVAAISYGQTPVDVANPYPTQPNPMPSVTPGTAVNLPPSTPSGGASADNGTAVRPKFAPVALPQTTTPVLTDWTATGRLYANPNGSYTFSAYPGKANYLTEGGSWAPVDVSLTGVNIGPFDLATTANDIALNLSDQNADTALGQLQTGSYTLKFRAPGYGAASTATPSPAPTESPAPSKAPALDAPGSPSPSPSSPAASSGPSQPPATSSPTDSSEPGPSTSPAVSSSSDPDPSPTDSAIPSPSPNPAVSSRPVASDVPSPSPSSAPTPSPSATPPPTTPTSLTFPGSADSGAINVVPTAEGVELSATLANSTEHNVYAFAVDAGSLQAIVAADGLSINLIDPTATPPAGSSGPVVAGRIGSPQVSDAKGAVGSDSDVSVQLVELGATTIPAGVDPSVVAGLGPTEVLVVYTINPTWLAAPERVFPVVMDPTFCLQNNTGCTAGSFDDTIASGHASTHFNLTTDKVGLDAQGLGNGLMRTLLYFPFISLPDGSEISSADLAMVQSANHGTTATTLVALEVTSTWDSSTSWSGSPTGTDKEPSTTTVHESPAKAVCASTCTDHLDVSAIVRDWYTRRGADWANNLGFELQLGDETKNEVDLDSTSFATTTSRPLLTLTTTVPSDSIDFAPALGPDYAPSTMAAGGTTNLPILITNNSSATFNHANDANTWRYQAGYRWFNSKGALDSSGTVDLPADIASGGTSAQFSLPVTVPSAAGQFTLRLDVVLNQVNGAALLWGSDWAAPSTFYARDKRSLSPANTRWTGASPVERDEFSIGVVTSGGTSQGPNETVSLNDGSTLGINLWSHDLTLDASGGVGFNDLLPVELTYGYDSANVGDCTGILSACGWFTNWDERLIAGTTQGSYTYQAPDGNRYLVGTDDNGQLTSSAPVSLQRERFTVFDDNVLPWSPAATYDTSTTYGGSVFSTKINTSTTSGISANLSPTIPLNAYPSLDFAVKVAATTNQGAIALDLKDEATGTTGWIGYGFGASWTIPGMAWQTNIGNASTSWPTAPAVSFTEYAWHDAFLNGTTIFGPTMEGHDALSVVGIKLLGGGGAAGSIWFDGVTMSPRTSLQYNEILPSWTANSGNASLNAVDVAVGSESIQTAPTTIALSPSLQGLTQQMTTYPYLTGRWKKVGGSSIAEVISVEDLRTSTIGTITYYAGQNRGYTNPIQVSNSLPTSWTQVTRNVEDDARQILGFYNDNPSGSSPVPSQGPTPDDLDFTGYQLVAFDGNYALFDDQYLISQSGVDPASVISNFDFLVSESNGDQHWFNQDGMLEEITDRDGHAITLDYTYDRTGLGGPAAYTLTTIHAPSDGLPLSSGTAQRELLVTSAASGKGIRFTESLGSTTSSTGRYTELDRATTAAGDLVTVIPARYDAACATGTTPQGCLTFTYTGSHLLAGVHDPRESSAATMKTSIAWSGSDPTTITDAQAGQSMLKILTFDAGSSAGYLRPLWEDQAAIKANAARYVDLSPDGSALNDYVPKTCTGSCTIGSSGTYPATPTASDLLDSTSFDGLGRPALQVSYQTTGTGGLAGPEIVTRRATNAAAGVDNLNDPLSSAETVWQQSSDQYYASVSSGMVDRYRTTYAYDTMHDTIDTVVPHLAPLPSYVRSVTAPGNLKGEWRVNETSGTTMTDSSGLTHNGTYSGTPTLGGTGSLVGDATNKSVTLNGTTQYASVTGSSLGTISSSYTVEAWAKTTTTTAYQDIVGTRNPNNFGFDLKFGNDGQTLHSDIGSGTAWLSTTADAKFPFVANQWYFIAETVGGGSYAIYVNGVRVGSGGYSGTALLTDATHNLYLGQYGGGGEYLAGSLDEAAVYSAVLDPATIAGQVAQGSSIAPQDVQTSYTTTGHPVTVSDNTFIANPDFEAGQVGWTFAGSSATATTGAGIAHGGLWDLQVTGSGTATQVAQLLPGQTARFQLYGKVASSAHATYALTYWQTSSSTWHTFPGATQPAGSITNTSWTAAAYDVTVPFDGDGRVQLVLSNNAATGTASFDDVAVLTTYETASYTTSAPTGLLTDHLIFAPQGTAGGAPGMVDTKTAYAANTVLPAIEPRTVTRNYIDGTYDPTQPDQDLTSLPDYDTWGRTISQTDADGVNTTTAYAANLTDVASTTDGVGDTTTYTYDGVGNQLTVKTPLNETTTTTYDLEGNPLTVTSPASFSIVTANTYDHGQLTQSVADSGGLAVTTTYAYDAFGHPTQTIADTGTGHANTETDTAYDSIANVIQTTVYSDSAHTQSRVTHAAFDSTGSPVITRAKPSASWGPIAPSTGRLCPDSGSQHCNSDAILAFDGTATTIYDAYGVATAGSYDFAGHTLRAIANFVTGTYSSAHPDQDVTTTSSYDLAGNLVGLSDTLGQATTTVRDAVGRPTKVIKPDSSWIRTDYTAADRVLATSHAGSSAQGDSDVTWTKNVYDSAGRQVATLDHWDRTGSPNDQFQLTSFESGLAEGVKTNVSNLFVSPLASSAVTVGTASSGSANTGFDALQVVSNTTSNEGASLPIAGTFVSGHTYTAVLWATGNSAGQAWAAYLGVPSAGSYASSTLTSTSGWQRMTVSWTPSSTVTTGVLLAFRVNNGQSTGNTAAIDDLEVWDTGSPTNNIPSITAFDADSHAVASVLPGGHAGDAPMVTRTAYDSLGRVTDVTVAAVAGAGTAGIAANLVTHSAYDNLNDKLSSTDPKAVKTSYAYDRIGDPTSTIQGDDGASWSSSSPDHDVKSTFAYDALGELISYCPARNMVSGLSCTVTSGSEANAWHYGFDAAGHQVLVTAPVATGLSSANRLDVTSTTYDAGGRQTQVCSYPTSGSSCTSADRYTTTGYDAEGRSTTVQTYSGAPGSGTLRLKWTTTYQGDGYPTSVAFDGTGSSPSEGTDTLTYTPDTLDRTTAIKRGATVLTSYVYNPDDTASSRTDTSTFVTSLAYDWAGRPTSVASASIDSGAAATFAYRNDGLLDTRAWSGTNATAAVTYDAAKRPTQIAISGSGVAAASVSQTYDRNGNVATEGRSFAGISGASGTGTATFTNDQLNRVTADGISGGNSYAYAYDPDGNRTSVTINAGTPTVSTYDATDQLLTQGPSGGTLLSFNYDPYGNMIQSAETFNSSVTAYTYDFGDRLTKITPPAGLSGAQSFTLDALGRIATETLGAATTTISYVGTSKTASRLTTGATNVDSLLGSDGSRLATASGASFGWLLPDLHGDIAGASSASLATVTDALRYDAFGTIAAATTSALPTPWRYQGELLVNPAGASDLYGNGARFYAPGLGAFTQLDTSQGSALNPMSLNRFLYAAANPENLIDPSGHRYCTTQNADNCDGYRPRTSDAQKKAILKSYEKKQKAKADAKQTYAAKKTSICKKYGDCGDVVRSATASQPDNNDGSPTAIGSWPGQVPFVVGIGGISNKLAKLIAKVGDANTVEEFKIARGGIPPSDWNLVSEHGRIYLENVAGGPLLPTEVVLENGDPVLDTSIFVEGSGGPGDSGEGGVGGGSGSAFGNGAGGSERDW